MKNSIKTTIALLFAFLIFSSCTSDDDQNTDNLSPTLQIISPTVNQEYIAGWGGDWGGDDITLAVKAMDNIKIASIVVRVAAENGDTLFEKTFENLSNNEIEFSVSEVYNSEATFMVNTKETVIFTATDSSGNETTASRDFTVKPLN